MRMNIDGVVGEITTLAGCSQIAISHGVFLRNELRGKGIGKQANKKRIELCNELGYDYIICTVDLSNSAQIKILEANSWKLLDTFESSKTKHFIGIYARASAEH